jgi:hypothetical protein
MYIWSAQKEHTRVWTVWTLNRINVTLWAIPENFQKNRETENVNEMFTSIQPHQDATFRRRFREWLHSVADGLVEPQLTSDISCGSTQASATAWRWGRNVGEMLHFDTAVCSRFYSLLWPRELQDRKRVWLQTYVYSVLETFLRMTSKPRVFTLKYEYKFI